MIRRLPLFFIAVSVLFFSLSAHAQALLQAGAEAPAFTLKDLDGKAASLADFAKGNKAVVLVFWSTWSPRSDTALKRFEEFHLKYRGRGVQVVGVNADNQTITPEDRQKIRRTALDLKLTFPLLIDEGLKTFHAYNVIALPSTVVVTEGKIAYELPGLPLTRTEDLFDYLLALAGEPARTKLEARYQPRYDAVAATNLARGLVAQKRPEQAEPLFRKAIEKDPRYMLPYVELAKLSEAEGKTAEAEELLAKALAIDPESLVVAAELGYLQAKTGKLKEAIALLEETVKKNSYPPGHYYLAYAFGRNGQLKAALAAFDEALALNPYEPTAYTLRAEVYQKNGQLKEAAADYRKALELLLGVRW